MMRVYCVDNLAVTVEDLYFVDPDPDPGQEGPERGIRLELRLLEPQPHRGSIYAAQRIVADQALWRADLLESVACGPGSNDRMHYHPVMRDNEPGKRVFTRDLTGDPIGWLAGQLGEPEQLLTAAGVDVRPYQAACVALRAAAAEIVECARATLEGVRAGRLAPEPAGSGVG